MEKGEIVMKKLFEQIRYCMKKGENLALVTIIADSGSTPRGAGARMLVHENGKIFGTIGGGDVEYKAQQLAAEVIKEKKSYIKAFKLVSEQIEDLGMICGGNVLLYFQFIAPDNHKMIEFIDHLLTIFDYYEDSWIITEIIDNTEWNMGIYSKSIGLYGLDIALKELSKMLISHGVNEVSGNRKFYIEPLVRSGRVIVIGGGHVAQELVPVLSHIDFRCIVIDDRKQFANKNIFPTADKVIVGEFTNIEGSVNITNNDYIVVMTRGHSYDYEVLKQVMKTNAYYVGVIGSNEKMSKIFGELRHDGFTQKDLDSIFTPIGIAIKAETPAEISISIAAELIMARAEKQKKNG